MTVPLRQSERAGIEEAVRAIEARSRAEVVVSIRERSGLDSGGSFLFGAATGVALCAFLLFSPWEFSLMVIWAGPPLAGALAAFAAVRVGALDRLLTSRDRRRETVLRAARATFVERGVAFTRERTGILVYISLREREAAVVADKGVTDIVPTDAWTEAVSRVETAARAGDGATGVIAALAGMGELLAGELPRRPDDVNELTDVAEAL